MLDRGELIDIWVVEKSLGSGGMGSVYRCHNRDAPRILAAVKVLDSNIKRHRDAEARFIREAEILFSLDHPNIVRVRNVRIDHMPPYLEMEFVAGTNLADKIRGGPADLALGVDVMSQVADALAYIHGRGVFHRDIKPANLVISRHGVCKLVDFGLATEREYTPITEEGVNFGTVAYAPPEWATPDELDPMRWDLYAAGVVFYEMFSGKLAFRLGQKGNPRQQAIQVMLKKQSHPPLDPGPTFHPDLRALIQQLTNPDIGQRLGSARELMARVAEIRDVVLGRGIEARPQSREGSSDSHERLPGLPQITDTPPPRRISAPGTPVRVPRSTAPGDIPQAAFARTGESVSLLELEALAAVGWPSEAPPVPEEEEEERYEELPVIEDFLDLHGERIVEVAPAERPKPVEAPRPAEPSGEIAQMVMAGVVLLVLGAAMMIGLAAWRDRQEAQLPAPRAVIVELSGAPDDILLRLDGREPDRRDGTRFTFDAVIPGTVKLVAVTGEGCAPTLCPGPQCPSTCGITQASRAVLAGPGPQTIVIPVGP